MGKEDQGRQRQIQHTTHVFGQADATLSLFICLHSCICSKVYVYSARLSGCEQECRAMTARSQGTPGI